MQQFRQRHIKRWGAGGAVFGLLLPFLIALLHTPQSANATISPQAVTFETVICTAHGLMRVPIEVAPSSSIPSQNKDDNSDDTSGDTTTYQCPLCSAGKLIGAAVLVETVKLSLAKAPFQQLQGGAQNLADNSGRRLTMTRAPPVQS